MNLRKRKSAGTGTMIPNGKATSTRLSFRKEKPIKTGATGIAVFKALTANLLLSRSDYMRGSIEQGGIDIDKECKYPSQAKQNYQLYWQLYNQDGLANRIINFLADECWAITPDIYESEQARDTPFEKAARKLVTRVNLWSNMHLGDRLCGIGQFGGMFLGYNDDRKLELPVAGFDDFGKRTRGRALEGLDLVYVQPFHQGPLRIVSVDTDEKSPRRGQPTMYAIRMLDPAEGMFTQGVEFPSNKGEEVKVHWTRMIHLLDGRTSSRIVGNERLRPLIPRVYDCRKILGGSGQMFWAGGFPGISFETHPNMEDPDLDEEALKKEIEEYALGLKRYMRLIGMVAKSLAPQVADPSNHMTEQYQAIAMHFGSPLRIFLGAEAGHQASTQDRFNWNIRLGLRQNRDLTSNYLRPFFDRQIMFGVLPTPTGGPEEYVCSWKDMNTLTETDRADFGLKVTQALLQYVTSGGWKMMKPLQYLTNVLLYPLSVAQAIVDSAGGEAAIATSLQTVLDATAGNTKDTTTTNPTSSTGAGGQRNSQGKGKAPRGSKVNQRRR